MTALEQVREDFTARELPYDAALSSLDLAVLWLEKGKTAEVPELAVGMGSIFQAKGVDRQALAALTLFCEAARQEAATVELTRRVITEIETVRRSGAPRTCGVRCRRHRSGRSGRCSSRCRPACRGRSGRGV